MQTDLKKKISHNVTLAETRSEVEACEARVTEHGEEFKRRIHTLGETMHGQGQSIDALSADLKAASSHMNEVEAQVTHAEHWNRIMPQLSKTLGCLMNLCLKHGFMYYITPQSCPEEASFINRSQSSHTWLIVLHRTSMILLILTPPGSVSVFRRAKIRRHWKGSLTERCCMMI